VILSLFRTELTSSHSVSTCTGSGSRGHKRGLTSRRPRWTRGAGRTRAELTRGRRSTHRGGLGRPILHERHRARCAPNFFPIKDCTILQLSVCNFAAVTPPRSSSCCCLRSASGFSCRSSCAALLLVPVQC
jgi:hypothetical protein